MRILLTGNGKMGREIRTLAEAQGYTVAAAFDSASVSELISFDRPADVIIDFSAPAALESICNFVGRTGTPLVCGTTGYDEDQTAALRKLGEAAPVLYSANFSIGIAVMKKILGDYGPYLLAGGFDCELEEIHHRQKADAPSGTAKALLAALDSGGSLDPVYGRSGKAVRRNKEIGIHALRGGTEAGTHSVFFFGEDETLQLRHSASSRTIFARGALTAAEKLCRRGAGFYTFEEIIFSSTDKGETV